MMLQRFKQRLARIRQRTESEEFDQKKMVAAAVCIILVLMLSLYAFSMDIVMGYTNDQEAFVQKMQNNGFTYSVEQKKEKDTTNNQFSKPEHAATAVPGNQL